MRVLHTISIKKLYLEKKNDYSFIHRTNDSQQGWATLVELGENELPKFDDKAQVTLSSLTL